MELRVFDIDTVIALMWQAYRYGEAEGSVATLTDKPTQQDLLECMATIALMAGHPARFFQLGMEVLEHHLTTCEKGDGCGITLMLNQFKRGVIEWQDGKGALSPDITKVIKDYDHNADPEQAN